MKYDRDMRYWVSCRHEQIRNEGISQGAYQKAVETARNALSMNLTPQQIANLTGLSVDEIEKL